MRHILLLPACMVLIACHPLAAQPIDSLRPVVLSDSARHVLSLNYRIGTTPVTTAPLNEFLAQHGYGSNRFSDETFDNLALNVGMSMTINRWLIEPEVSGVLPMRSSQNGTDVSHNFWSIQSNVGYQILRAGAYDEFALYPFAGIGARMNRLTIAENPQGTFAAILNDSSSRSYSFSNEALYGEIGVGTDYGIRLSEDERSVTSLVFGLRAGYQFGILSEDWQQSGNDQRITDGPDMKPHGVSAWITVGWRIQPRLYDARIVAEREPTREIEHESRLQEPTPMEEKEEQPWRLGVKGGLNRGWIGNPESETDMQAPRWLTSREAATFGLMANYRIGTSFSLQSELLYSAKGGGLYESSFYQLSQGTAWDSAHELTITYSADYIEVPLLLRTDLFIGKAFSLNLIGGVYGAVLLSSSIEYQRQYAPISGSSPRPGRVLTDQRDLDAKPFDAGSVFGFGLNLHLGGPSVSLEGRTSTGFATIATEEHAIRNTVGSVMLSYWW